MSRLLSVVPQSTIDRLFVARDITRLESLVDVTWRKDFTRKTSEAEYRAGINQVKPDILMTGWDSPLLTPAILDQNPQLKYVVNLTGELKKYIHRDCIARGLIVTNWGDVPSASVAEATLMMTLASLRRAYFWQIQMHEKKAWNKRETEARWVPKGLFDKTVGLYGFGLIARLFVPMIKPFSPRILVFTSWLSDEDKAEFGVEPVGSLKELFAESDVVSIHTGNRPDTFHSVNAEMLAAMKDNGHIINTARGPIIDTAALVAELKTGRLFAALDVFEEEMEGKQLPPESPLRGLPNCLLFPHQGGPTDDYAARCGRHAVDQVQRHLRNEPLLHIINLKQYDRMT